MDIIPVRSERTMDILTEKKRKRFRIFFLNSPLFLVLVVINVILIGWVIHLTHVIFTDGLSHMTLYEWTEHLFVLAKNTFENLFASIAIVL